jgi:hypothetical protein
MDKWHEREERLLPDIWHRQSRQTKICLLVIAGGVWAIVDDMIELCVRHHAGRAVPGHRPDR